MKTAEQLRDLVADTMARFDTGELDVDHARTIALLCGRAVQLTKLQLQETARLGSVEPIKFLKAD